MRKRLAGGWHECGHNRPAKSPQGAKGIVNGLRFIAAMDHAVGALLVSASSVVVPVRVLDELPEGRGVAVLEQITRLLPAENVVGGIAPWRALVVHLAHEEVQKERRLVEPPVFLGRVQDAREHLPRPLSLEKVLLIGCLLVTVPRR